MRRLLLLDRVLLLWIALKKDKMEELPEAVVEFAAAAAAFDLVESAPQG